MPKKVDSPAQDKEAQGQGAFPPFIPAPSGTSGKKSYEPDPKPSQRKGVKK